MTPEQRIPRLGSLNFLVRLRFVNRRLIQYKRIPTNQIRGSRVSLAREGSANEGSVVSRGGHAGSKLIRCCRAVDTLGRSNVRRPRWKGNRKGTIRSCCVQESTHVDPAFTFVHGVHRCHPLVRSWASFFLPAEKKPSLLTNTGSTITILSIASVRFDFLLDNSP